MNTFCIAHEEPSAIRADVYASVRIACQPENARPFAFRRQGLGPQRAPDDPHERVPRTHPERTVRSTKHGAYLRVGQSILQSEVAEILAIETTCTAQRTEPEIAFTGTGVWGR